MTTLDDRPTTALLVIDVQHGVIDHAHAVEQVTATIADLVDRARTAGTPVVWVQHHGDQLERGSAAWEYVPALQPDQGEPVVHKAYGDAFEDTDLEAVLAERGVGHLVVSGAQTDACIRSTLHGAMVRGYDTTLVADGHTTEDLREWGSPVGPAEAIAYTNLYWSFSDSPGRESRVVPAAELDLTTA